MILFQIAEFLEIQGVQFKPRAYRRAAQTIESLPMSVEDVYNEGKLQELPGIGVSIAKKIEEYLKTGRLEYYEKLKRELPIGLLRLTSVPGLGPKRAKTLYDKLGVESLEELELAASEHKISNLEGFGEKLEKEILEAVWKARKKKERKLLGFVLPIASEIINELKKIKEVKAISPAGSLRRKKDTVGDVDVLVSSLHAEKIMDHFTSLEMVTEVLAKGDTKSSVVLDSGLQVDLQVVNKGSYGSALQYFTGSKQHNIKLRKIAIEKNLKLNEYGVFSKISKEKIAGESEEEVYSVLGLPFIEPELREDRGEVEAAVDGRLPKLLEVSDVKGDLHIHSNWSDGTASITELAKHGQQMGYEYICITDHTSTLRIAHGLSEEKILEQINVIEQVNNDLEGFEVLSGAEVNLMADGSLDVSNEVLQKLDVVIAAVHTGFKADSDKMTKRLLKGIENENIDIVGHPTGRIIDEREGYTFDFEEVFDAAKDAGVCFEINAFPDRLDLNDINTRIAKERGVTLSIGTDSHTLGHMRYMEFGVAVARRGWLEKEDVINTLSITDLKRRLNR